MVDYFMALFAGDSPLSSSRPVVVSLCTWDCSHTVSAIFSISSRLLLIFGWVVTWSTENVFSSEITRVILHVYVRIRRNLYCDGEVFSLFYAFFLFLSLILPSVLAPLVGRKSFAMEFPAHMLYLRVLSNICPIWTTMASFVVYYACLSAEKRQIGVEKYVNILSSKVPNTYTFEIFVQNDMNTQASPATIQLALFSMKIT